MEPVFERLSAQDGSFLFFERPGNPMHVGAVAICEGGALVRRGGRVDLAGIRAFVESRLPLLPRYRQRIVWTPLSGQPGWVDDERFELARHLRFARIPRPGNDAQLKTLLASLLAEPLDRTRPLWELWIVEGLARRRFAIVTKVHHCMVDGVAGSGLLTTLFRPAPSEAIETPPTFAPRPAPHALALAFDDLAGGVGVARGASEALARALRSPAQAADVALRGVTAVWHTLRDGLRLVSPLPLRRRTEPTRGLDWCTLELAALKEVRKRLDCTVNDVVLTVVTGALRELLLERGTPVRDLSLRVVVPVNMRAAAQAAIAGNRVAAWFVSLPVDEERPLARFERVRAETARAKASLAAEGIDLLVQLVDAARAPRLVEAGVRLASWVHPHHLIVTNVAGPPSPLYLLGSRVETLVPQLPLLAGETLGVAVMSYAGRVTFGLFGDGALASDLPGLAHAVRRSFASLRRAAERRDRATLATSPRTTARPPASRPG
jgi:WS/DGAT/MGAT family acyltransferase